MSAELLLDNSAWARLGDTALAAHRAEEVADAIEAGRVAVSIPFLLEAGYSARSAEDHGQLTEELLALPQIHIDEEVEHRAVDCQRQLARIGHHRVPPVDLLIAALADCRDLGVLHYDGDFDLIRGRTDLDFESVWLAPRGSL